MSEINAGWPRKESNVSTKESVEWIGESAKFQAPNSRETSKSRYQTAAKRFHIVRAILTWQALFRSLEFGASLVLGVWSLGFRPHHLIGSHSRPELVWRGDVR